mmetsp:Transcript_13194/g.35717  ORF Transcript_13194/g.35717 Transcript_13194/m.35717 type:complete len:339 (-) Transcript_13194:291-1307(-)
MLRMPLLSTSNATSTFARPAAAGLMPSRMNIDNSLLSLAKRRSPWTTLISKFFWLSFADSKTLVFRTGTRVFLGRNTEQRPSWVAMLSVRGKTSSKIRSRISPVSTAPWMAAPTATTSSGFTLWFKVFPTGKNDFASSTTAGIRVDPPTSTTSSRSFTSTLASSSACSTGPRHRSTSSAQRDSNFWRVSTSSMVLGPDSSVAMKGREMVVSCSADRSILAFSAASFSRCTAWLSWRRSMPSCCLNVPASQSTMVLSKSSPPSLVSPLVASTSQTPSPTVRTDTSKVPPPRSKTMMVSLYFFSSPYAREAAVGSLTMRITCRPAILPASFVPWRWESLK